MSKNYLQEAYPHFDMSQFSEESQRALYSLYLENIILPEENLKIMLLMDKKEISKEEALKRILAKIRR